MSDAAPDNNVSFSVITVLYGSDAVLPAMLVSLAESAAAAGAAPELLLVDNGPTALDPALLPDGAVYRRPGRNLGFGRACNLAAGMAHGDFLLFLNPDARLRPGFFSALALAIAAYPQTAVFCAATWSGPRLYAQTLSWIECALNRLKPAKIPAGTLWGDCSMRFANGGAFAIRRSVFERIGGFDESIFLYLEDDDLSWRLINAGEPIVQVFDAAVDHVLGHSTAPSNRLMELRGNGKERAEIYLRRKYGIAENAALALARILAAIALHAITFNRRRLCGQIGRLKARLGIALE